MLSFTQGEVKGGALTNDGFRPDPTAMAMDNALHRRQANAGAWECGR
jgi:hypothetical protein